ncbi:MAG: hypothetical protein QW331_04615 [Candidatus Woesearchaeota archaeon]
MVSISGLMEHAVHCREKQESEEEIAKTLGALALRLLDEANRKKENEESIEDRLVLGQIRRYAAREIPEKEAGLAMVRYLEKYIIRSNEEIKWKKRFFSVRNTVMSSLGIFLVLYGGAQRDAVETIMGTTACFVSAISQIYQERVFSLYYVREKLISEIAQMEEWGLALKKIKLKLPYYANP